MAELLAGLGLIVLGVFSSLIGFAAAGLRKHRDLQWRIDTLEASVDLERSLRRRSDLLAEDRLTALKDAQSILGQGSDDWPEYVPPPAIPDLEDAVWLSEKTADGAIRNTYRH